MSAADTELDAAFTEFLGTAGDSVTFRGLSVSAVVSRTEYTAPKDKRFPDLSARTPSRIEFLKSAVASAPKAGEVISEGSSRHRIARVTDAGGTWQLDCEVSP
jgi:hypothetical protein